jgi:hypothetical protein
MLHGGKRQGQGGGLQHFLKSLGSVDCESDCCWVWADCENSEVTCEDSVGCEASCGDGSSLYISCKAT